VFARKQEQDLFIESFRKLRLPVCATEAQLAKFPDPKHLPECEAQRVKS
jgi:hypothetical protein